MSILNSIVKSAVDKKCAPSDEAIAKVKAWAHQHGPLYLEDFLVAAEPRDCIILTIINKEADVDTKEKIEKISSKLKHFIDTVSESGQFPEKVKVGYALRIFDPKGPTVDYKVVDVEDNKISFKQTDGSLILSDLVIVIDDRDRLSIMRSKLHPSGIRMAWGKSLTHKLITKLTEAGLKGDHTTLIPFSEKTRIPTHRLLDIMMGYVISPEVDEIKAIADALDIPFLELIGDDLKDIDLSPQVGK
ncbi:hypothetical protein OBP_292 [Pseudomonas phage OBP]|uniref:hypothetical protein n=1 Tax=Pseudomonas phage OBP TaxID=1124849 RepID=UPI000240D63F|nr:hypothetical protein OBP_292 [Pseudomonas phage OBP]AEV89729.1 hypothetical protein OBP_292 [Pseudomonas phage OBP]